VAVMHLRFSEFHSLLEMIHRHQGMELPRVAGGGDGLQI